MTMKEDIRDLTAAVKSLQSQVSGMSAELDRLASRELQYKKEIESLKTGTKLTDATIKNLQEAVRNANKTIRQAVEALEMKMPGALGQVRKEEDARSKLEQEQREAFKQHLKICQAGEGPDRILRFSILIRDLESNDGPYLALSRKERDRMAVDVSRLC